MARRRAVVTIQPPGFGGGVSQVWRATTKATLDRLLRKGDVAEEADQGRDRPSVLLSEDRRDGVVHPPWNGLTSTSSQHAADPFFAIASAASRSAASMTQKPPSCSLLSE